MTKIKESGGAGVLGCATFYKLGIGDKEEKMCDCGSGSSRGGGPYATGRELVEFVMAAHGGGVAFSPLPNGGLQVKCQECGKDFLLRTFVQGCPACGGVHAVSPPRANDPAAVQYAGAGFGAAC